MEVNVNEGGVTHTRGGKQWFILPAGCMLSSHFHTYFTKCCNPCEPVQSSALWRVGLNPLFSHRCLNANIIQALVSQVEMISYLDCSVKAYRRSVRMVCMLQ